MVKLDLAAAELAFRGEKPEENLSDTDRVRGLHLQRIS